MRPRTQQLIAATTILCLVEASAEVVTVDAADGERLIVTTWQANIELIPTSGTDLTVDYSCQAPQPPADRDGLRSVASQRVPLLSRNDEKIMLKADEAVGACRMRISAPAFLHPEIRVNFDGSVEGDGWASPFNAWVAAGDVTLTKQSGPVSVTAMSGAAIVEFVGDTLSADSAVSAANGPVVVWLTGSPDMTVRAQARWGDIRTDLPVEFVSSQDGNDAWSVAELGQGGAVLTLRNLNDDVEVRQGAMPEDFNR